MSNCVTPLDTVLVRIRDDIKAMEQWKYQLRAPTWFASLSNSEIRVTKIVRIAWNLLESNRTLRKHWHVLRRIILALFSLVSSLQNEIKSTIVHPLTSIINTNVCESWFSSENSTSILHELPLSLKEAIGNKLLNKLLLVHFPVHKTI